VTRTIPIVFATSGDPVKLGLVESLGRPGGTLTGLSTFYPELSTKHVEMLRDLVPGLSRVAILWNPTNEDAVVALKEAERAAQRLKLQAVPVGVKGPEEFANAFAAITKAEVGGLIVLGDAMLRVNRKAIVALAARSRLPAVYGPRDYAEAGGLLAYGVNIPMNFRRAAAFVDKILKGAKPGDLPVEQPTRLNLTINLKTAKALGITIPPGLFVLADDVIQ
jgi:putative ABC transport system substrate-binding protein